MHSCLGESRLGRTSPLADLSAFWSAPSVGRRIPCANGRRFTFHDPSVLSGLRHGPALADQHFDLQQLGHNLFGRERFPCHFPVVFLSSSVLPTRTEIPGQVESICGLSICSTCFCVRCRTWNMVVKP